MDREVGGEDFRNHQTKNYTLYILAYLDIFWFACMLKIQLFLIILSKKRGKNSPPPPPPPPPPTHTHTFINTGRTIPRLLRPCYECFNDISCYFCDISYMFYNRVASKMFYACMICLINYIRHL